jgi:hypothetical protein
LLILSIKVHVRSVCEAFFMNGTPSLLNTFLQKPENQKSVFMCYDEAGIFVFIWLKIYGEGGVRCEVFVK